MESHIMPKQTTKNNQPTAAQVERWLIKVFVEEDGCKNHTNTPEDEQLEPEVMMVWLEDVFVPLNQGCMYSQVNQPLIFRAIRELSTTQSLLPNKVVKMVLLCCLEHSKHTKMLSAPRSH